MLDWTNVERIATDVVALRPVYTDTGKATEVITKSGKRFCDQRDIRSVKQALHRSCFIDSKAQSKSVKELLGKEIALPFYLDPDRVFIPLKMRNPKTGSDPVYGYVDIAHIASIEPTPGNRCRLTLRSGATLDLLCTHATAIKSKELGLTLAESLKIVFDTGPVAKLGRWRIFEDNVEYYSIKSRRWSDNLDGPPFTPT